MDKICILHYSPIELYPPVLNFIKILESRRSKEEVSVLTTTANEKLKLFTTDSNNFQIIRLTISPSRLSKLLRLKAYLFFNIKAIFFLVKTKPEKVFYYETISSFPAVIYKKFFHRDATIIVHYHEYTSPHEYKTGMLLNRMFHLLERKSYQKMAWISHTNGQRVRLFKKDLLPLNIPEPKIVPNYPPLSWFEMPVTTKPDLPTRIVYVGSFGLTTMYVREMAEWVVSKNGQVVWDIYSYNLSPDAKEYVDSLNCNHINLGYGVDYPELPMILGQYHIGVILYKGHSANYIYNAPNKLFEYISLGLQVWVPHIMEVAKDYIDEQDVISINFAKLNELQLSYAGRKVDKISFSPFCSEKSLKPLADFLLQP